MNDAEKTTSYNKNKNAIKKYIKYKYENDEAFRKKKIEMVVKHQVAKYHNDITYRKNVNTVNNKLYHNRLMNNILYELGVDYDGLFDILY